MSQLSDVQDEIRERTVGHKIGETAETTNLHLSKADFASKLLSEPNGNKLLSLLRAGEHKACENMGLIHGYTDNEGYVWFDIPGWNAFVVHLKIVSEA